MIPKIIFLSFFFLGLYFIHRITERKLLAFPACSWLKPLLRADLRTARIRHAVKVLKKVDFDAIAVQGYSSAVIGSIVAYKLKKNLIVVRKEDEPRHSNRTVEGETNVKYVFIDDLVCMGETLKRVRRAVGGELVGVYLYHDFRTPELFKRDYDATLLSGTLPYSLDDDD